MSGVVVLCPLCGERMASVERARDGGLQLAMRSPAGGATRATGTVVPPVAHHAIHLNCRWVGCLADVQVCACQLREWISRARRRPWRWTPTEAEQADAVRCECDGDQQVTSHTTHHAQYAAPPDTVPGNSAHHPG